MAKRKRDLLKKTVAQVVNHYDSAGAYLQELYSDFAPVHPELAAGLKIAQEMTLQAMQIVATFAEAAFGYAPEDWDKWRQAPKKKGKEV